jgi:hypothetical protein
MGFENIQFNEEQLAELFGSRLVITGDGAVSSQEPVQAIKKATTAPLLGITGKNKKGFLWLVEEPDHPFLNDEDFKFLTDVLTACKMNMEDIALVNLAMSPLSFNELQEQFAPGHLVISATNNTRLPFQTPDYRVLQQTDYQVCCTETLTEIRNDKSKKSKLWLALKQMLGL